MNPQLEAFANNQEMFDAVKGEILKEFDLHAIDSDTFLNNNEQLGEIVRARVDGSNLVRDAFVKLERFRKPPKEMEEVNMGR